MSQSASKLYRRRSGDRFHQISSYRSGYWGKVNAEKIKIIEAIKSDEFPVPGPDQRYFEFESKKYSIIEDDDGNRYVRRRKAYTTGDPILSSGSYSKVDIGIMVPEGWTKAKGNEVLQMFSINKHHEREAEQKEKLEFKRSIDKIVRELGIGLTTTTIIRDKKYTDGTTVKKVYEIQPLGESLRSCLKQNRLNNEQKYSIAAQLAIIMGKMKSQNLYHRDLKPENIMIMWDGVEPTVKLIDFDFAAIGDQSLVDAFAGTPIFMPSSDKLRQEYCEGLEAGYTFSDKFAFGRVLSDMGINRDIRKGVKTYGDEAGSQYNTVQHTRIFSGSGIPYERIAVKYIFSELGIIINRRSVSDIDRKIVFAILAIYDAGIRDKENIEKLFVDGADAKVKAINVIKEQEGVDPGIKKAKMICVCLGVDGYDSIDAEEAKAINALYRLYLDDKTYITSLLGDTAKVSAINKINAIKGVDPGIKKAKMICVCLGVGGYEAIDAKAKAKAKAINILKYLDMADEANIQGLLGDGADAKVKAINILKYLDMADEANIQGLLGDSEDAKAKVNAVNVLYDAGIRDKGSIEKLFGDDADDKVSKINAIQGEDPGIKKAKMICVCLGVDGYDSIDEAKAINILYDAGIRDKGSIEKLFGDDADDKVSKINAIQGEGPKIKKAKMICVCLGVDGYDSIDAEEAKAINALYRLYLDDKTYITSLLGDTEDANAKVQAINILKYLDMADEANIEGLLGDGADAKVKAINTLNDAGIADNENIEKLFGDDANTKVKAINRLADIKILLKNTSVSLENKNDAIFSCFRKKPRIKSLLDGFDDRFKLLMSSRENSLDTDDIRKALSIHRVKVCHVFRKWEPKSLQKFNKIVSPEE